MNYQRLIEDQRSFFASGATLDVQKRKQNLIRLRNTIISREQLILDALYADLHKSDFEGYMSEVGIVLEELRFIIRNMSRWARPKRVRTPLTQFPGSSFQLAEPFGVTLIMAPWNYPFQLCLSPLIGALSAGNTVVLKPSAYAPHTSEVIAQLLQEVFDPSYVAVVQGGRQENEELLEQHFDYIFFTGSSAVGKIVMERAALHLTPVSLELGGKSPAIVDATADLKLAAKRIAFGKLLNAGQTCIAPDYVLVESSVKDVFTYYVKQIIEEFFPLQNYENFPSIINEKHFDRLMQLVKDENIILGGDGDRKTRHIRPTILENVLIDSPIMQEEIFGPILPILTFDTIDEAIKIVTAKPKPLALYLFTKHRQVEKRILREVSFGGGCINDTIMHIATSHMGFGGVGESGMGSYHGKASFDTFSHYKGVVRRYPFFDFSFRYHPYSERKFNLLKKILK